MHNIFHIPLNYIYEYTDDEFNGIFEEWKTMNEETAPPIPGQANVRRATARELNMLEGSKT